jgi:N-acetylglucosamine kinase-like BadF-type ATPase
MLIIIESGSTKADWLIIKDENRIQHSTMGFNPFFHSSQFVADTLANDEVLNNYFDEFGEIYFYGAGCSSPELNKVVQEGFLKVFKQAKVSVDHDLLAAGLSLFRNKDVIACILGTGSNSVYFDGKNLSEEVPALGYILGDEGSGSFFGKRILADFLYKRLPQELQMDVEKLGLTKDEIFKKVYMESNANVFLASMSPVLINNKHLEYCQQLIRQGFELFLDRHVLCFPNCFEVEVSFVGSISALLSDELSVICKEKGLTIGQIIRRPIDALAEYHLSNMINK